MDGLRESQEKSKGKMRIAKDWANIPVAISPKNRSIIFSKKWLA